MTKLVDDRKGQLRTFPRRRLHASQAVGRRGRPSVVDRLRGVSLMKPSNGIADRTIRDGFPEELDMLKVFRGSSEC